MRFKVKQHSTQNEEGPLFCHKKSVTKKASQKPTPGDISGTKKAILDPRDQVSKQPEKIPEKTNLQNVKSFKGLNFQILGLVGFFQKFTKHHGCGIFLESPG